MYNIGIIILLLCATAEFLTLDWDHIIRGWIFYFKSEKDTAMFLLKWS